MAFSENMTSYENWTFRPSATDSWMSEVFARETETLTKALQKSLSNDSETLTESKPPPLFNIVATGSTPTGSGSDQDASSRRRNAPKSNGGKITKRKSRASKKSPTTFITADPSNFRQMVQQVTGIRFSNSQMPVIPVLKPEPQRFSTRIQNCALPSTLDTSTFLAENNFVTTQRQHLVGPGTAAQGSVSFGHVAEGGGGGGGGGGLDFDTFQSFPTLESWRVM